jgi:hypothetical protein
LAVTLDEKCEIPVLNPVPAANVQEIVTFVDEACVQKSARPDTTRFTESSIVDNDIKSILARPYKITTGVLANNTATMYTADLNRGFFSAQAASRLSGVYGIRAKMVFKVQVVATPFDQGRLKLCFQPLTFAGDTSTYSAFRLSNAIQLPGVELDLNTQTEAVFSIPWVYPKDFLVLNSYNGQADNMPLGRIGLVPIIPWSSGSGTAPRYTVWFWLEDVEFYGTTGTPAIVADPVSGLLEAAAGIAAYHEACKEHPEVRISTISKKLLGWTAMVGAKFPKLRSAFQPAEWVIEKVGNTAASWGFSRPLATKPPRRVVATSATPFGHMDTPDYGYTLSASAKNEKPGVTFGCDMDEMAIQYLGASWGLTGITTFSPADGQGALLFHAVNTPGAMFFNLGAVNKKKAVRSLQVQAAGTPIVTAHPAPAAFVANVFQYWRGRVQYRLQFGKTAFHAGRIRVTVVPNEVIAGNTGAVNTCLVGTTLNGTNYSAVSYVVDIKGQNDFEFEVPWDYQVPWKNPVDMAHSVMYIQVEEPLVAPATCAQSITINVLVRVLDMEVALPIAPRWQPYPPSLVAADVSGDIDEVDSPAPPEPLRTPITLHYVSGDASSTMGEQINSIKQLVQIQTLTHATQHTVRSNVAITMPPEDWRPIGTTTAVISPSFNRYLDYFASAYRAYTGGQSFTILTRPSTPVVVYRGNTNRPEDWSNLSTFSSSMATIASGETEVRFKLPFQEVTPVVPLSAGIYNSDIAYKNIPKVVRSTFTYSVDPTTTPGGITKHGIFSGASDDFRFYYFAVTPIFSMSRNNGDPRPSDAFTTYTTQ